MIGLLLFNNDLKTDLRTKITKAVDAYQRKFQRLPEVCLVNPGDLETEQKRLDIAITSVKIDGREIEVRPFRSVLPHHFWAAIEDTSINGQANLVAQQSKNIEKQSRKLLEKASDD